MAILLWHVLPGLDVSLIVSSSIPGIRGMKLPKTFYVVLLCAIVLCIVSVVLFKLPVGYVLSTGDQAFAKEFADMQNLHIAAARKSGFDEAPLKDRQNVMRVADLEHLKSCRFYKVNKMRYGMPSLTPSAKEELASLARDFQTSCHSKSLSRARLIVTSALRTEKDVQNLREGD